MKQQIFSKVSVNDLVHVVDGKIIIRFNYKGEISIVNMWLPIGEGNYKKKRIGKEGDPIQGWENIFKKGDNVLTIKEMYPSFVDGTNGEISCIMFNDNEITSQVAETLSEYKEKEFLDKFIILMQELLSSTEDKEDEEK